MSVPNLDGVYHVFKVPGGWELRPGRWTDSWTYRSESLGAVMDYLRNYGGYPAGFEVSVIFDPEQG